MSHGLTRGRFLRSSVILALPGLLFSVLFTLPNYFMLTTNHHNDPVLESLNVNETELQVLRHHTCFTQLSLYLLFTNVVGRLKDINWTTGNNTETLRNVSTSQGLIQVIVRDEVPFKVSRSRSRARDTTLSVPRLWASPPCRGWSSRSSGVTRPTSR